jgi:hypothetical protein
LESTGYLAAVRPEYKILSERLIQEVIDRSTRSGFRPQDVQIRPPFTGATFARPGGDQNFHVLAERVETALDDQTGTPEYPGEYIGLRARFSGWIFTFHIERAKVAWLASDSSQTLVVLCTSAENVIGYDVREEPVGWRPSEAMGLREVVMALRGGDAESLIDFQVDAGQQRQMARDAAWITSVLRRQGVPEFAVELDVLLRPYVYVEDVAEPYNAIGDRMYDIVIVGAPLWGRVPSALPPPGLKE